MSSWLMANGHIPWWCNSYSVAHNEEHVIICHQPKASNGGTSLSFEAYDEHRGYNSSLIFLFKLQHCRKS